MSERKVLNKYYPPDFDPTKIPKVRRPKSAKAGVFSIRLMAPFNMRCNTCGEYIYKGKKFNSRKETVENENYLGLHIFRFYIKCPRCIAEIAFKTDPMNTDYELEAGATRNFEATRTAEKMALQEQKEKEAEEANNPMKLLENRTKASCMEMEMLETLEDLRELRHRHAGIDPVKMLEQKRAEAVKEAERQLQQQEQEDEEFVRSIFGHDGTGIVVKRLGSDEDDDDDEDDDKDDAGDDESSHHSGEPSAKVSRLACTSKASDLLTETTAVSKPPTSVASWNRSVGAMKCQLSGLVRPKTASAAAATAAAATAATISTTSSPPESQVVVVGSGAGDVSRSSGLAGLGVSGGGSSSGAASSLPCDSSNSGSVSKSAGLAGLGAYGSSSSDSDGGDA